MGAYVILKMKVFIVMAAFLLVFSSSEITDFLNEETDVPAGTITETSNVQHSSPAVLEMESPTSASETFTHKKTVLLQAQSTLQTLKKQGLLHDGCKKVAENDCQLVRTTMRNRQATINSQSTGAECLKIGYDAVHKAVQHHKRLLKISVTIKTQVERILNTQVTIQSRKFSSLKYGKCGWVFMSRSYISTKHQLRYIRKKYRIIMGRVMEAQRLIVLAKQEQIRLQTKCRCHVLKRRDRIWATFTSKTEITRISQMYQKCTMMLCILAGVSPSNAKCKARIQTLTNKRLDTITEKLKLSGVCKKGSLGGGELTSKEQTAKKKETKSKERRSKKGNEAAKKKET